MQLFINVLLAASALFTSASTTAIPAPQGTPPTNATAAPRPWAYTYYFGDGPRDCKGRSTRISGAGSSACTAFGHSVRAVRSAGKNCVIEPNIDCCLMATYTDNNCRDGRQVSDVPPVCDVYTPNAKSFKVLCKRSS